MRPFVHAALILVTMLAYAKSSFAQEAPIPLPSLDVDANCEELVLGPKPSESGRHRMGGINVCVEYEQAAYDFLKAVWADVAEKDKPECLSYFHRTSYRKYTALANCVRGKFVLERMTKRTPFRP